VNAATAGSTRPDCAEVFRCCAVAVVAGCCCSQLLLQLLPPGTASLFVTPDHYCKYHSPRPGCRDSCHRPSTESPFRGALSVVLLLGRHFSEHLYLPAWGSLWLPRCRSRRGSAADVRCLEDGVPLPGACLTDGVPHQDSSTSSSTSAAAAAALAAAARDGVPLCDAGPPLHAPLFTMRTGRCVPRRRTR
jgi:hypothetical protein